MLINQEKKKRALASEFFSVNVLFSRIGTVTLWENIILMGNETVTLPQQGRESQEIVLSLGLLD